MAWSVRVTQGSGWGYGLWIGGFVHERQVCRQVASLGISSSWERQFMRRAPRCQSIQYGKLKKEKNNL